MALVQGPWHGQFLSSRGGADRRKGLVLDFHGVCGVLHAGNFSLGFCDACKKKLGSYLELLLLVLLPILQAVESLCSISMDRSSEASNTNSG